MDDAAIVEYEREREKWNLDESATATGKKSGCGKLLLYVILGILIFKLFGELLFIFK